MALRDLLWSCPRCPGTSLTPVRGGARCQACGTTYHRGRGDEIIARTADGNEERGRAAEWLDRLAPEPDDATHGPEPALLRLGMQTAQPVRHDDELIGWIERFGERIRGRVELANDMLRFQPDAGGEPVFVAVDDLTSIQPSSRSLLLGRRGDTPIALEFPASSARHWELRLQRAVLRRWAACGRGDVFAYQPRIAAR